MSELLDNIKKSEGFRPTVYKCTAGHDTIGYGFAIKDLHLDEDLAEIILRRKVKELMLRVQQKFPFIVDMPDEIQNVVVEMCFQMGLSGFSKFKKTISLLESR